MLEQKKYVRLMFSLVLFLVALIFIALCAGRFSANPVDVLNAFITKLHKTPGNQAMENVVFLIRIPRIAAAILIGAALSVSGAVYQSTFRNPLVSPDLLGVSSGASMGAAIAILLGLHMRLIQLFAFCGGIAAVMLASALPKILRNSSNMMLVLSGIIVSGFMNSVLGITKFFAEEQSELASIVFWQMGSLASINTTQILSVMPTIVICLIVLLMIAWRLNILSFGEQEAKTVGVNVPGLRGVAVICASLLTASAVCISGTIGWIGLIIPHFGRLICGSDNTKLLPATIFLGGSFLLIIDTFARTATSMEIPLSILSGIIGAPLYAWLLYRQKAKII